jgi:hypothetical protein
MRPQFFEELKKNRRTGADREDEERQLEKQKQIPFGNDKKEKQQQMRGFFASLRMTAAEVSELQWRPRWACMASRVWPLVSG